MNKPRLLDLFCGAGGASMGYHRAGFDVVGVDIKPQPHYPFEFIQCSWDEALAYLPGLWEREGIRYAVHASPPCQHYSVMTNGRWQDRIPDHPDLIAPIREALKEIGVLYVIENVAGAKEYLLNPIMLCGTMFGLQTKEGSQLRRHRYFEATFMDMILVPPCAHNKASVIGVYGGGQNPARRRPVTIGVWGHAGGSSNRDGLVQFGTDARREAMGIKWMSGNELSEAIPPAYTEYIGKYLMLELKQRTPKEKDEE